MSASRWGWAAVVSVGLIAASRGQSTASADRYCGTAKLQDLPNVASAVPGDCGLAFNNPDPAYGPTDVREVTVVVHVIHRVSGFGKVPPSKIEEQIRLTNEHLRAFPGGSGELGVDTRIQVRLASVDPNGNPSTGITYTPNDVWFFDYMQNPYWLTLAWDPNRYLNLYVLDVALPLGYAFVPQQGSAGLPEDRVVVDYTALGENAPCGPPMDGGKIATHEVAHWLGLWDSYGNGCGIATTCNQTGDLICDTFPQLFNPLGNCAPNTTCGHPASLDNYMGSGGHACQTRFTEEQARRMRCTLDFWRPAAWQTVDVGAPYCAAQPNSTGWGAQLRGDGSLRVADDRLALLVDSAPADKAGLFLFGPSATSVPFGDGTLCVSGQIRRLPLKPTDGEGRVYARLQLASQPLANVAFPGVTTRFQFWFRDPTGGPAGINLSNGLAVLWQ